MAFVYVGGRRCLNFVGTMKHRDSTPEELFTQPELLSGWAVQAGLLDAAMDVTVDDLVAAIDLREAVYRTVSARLDGRIPRSDDVDLLNDGAVNIKLPTRTVRHDAT